MVVDAPILRIGGRRWEFPSGALLTGLLVAMVLSPHEPWYVAAVTAAVGVVSKYVVRGRIGQRVQSGGARAVATFYVFDTGQSWWGALPEVRRGPSLRSSPRALFITDRVNKMPLVLAFLGVYYLLFTVDRVRRRSGAGRRDLLARRICTPRCSSRSSS